MAELTGGCGQLWAVCYIALVGCSPLWVLAYERPLAHWWLIEPIGGCLPVAGLLWVATGGYVRLVPLGFGAAAWAMRGQQAGCVRVSVCVRVLVHAWCSMYTWYTILATFP